MPPGDPEWLSATFVNVVHWDDGHPTPVRCQMGVVRMPDSGDLQLASQVAGRPMYIYPPGAAARMIGVLREGLNSL
ncbi:hypothetical protein [Actinophytocola sp.]|uniref:hypothetical protein n=1 Tax=Actinophytocola sp. TaxID=1872138 RepID=UPI00389B05D4